MATIDLNRNAILIPATVEIVGKIAIVRVEDDLQQLSIDRVVVNGREFIPKEELDEVNDKNRCILEKLAEERIELEPSLSQVKKDKLELMRWLRETHGRTKVTPDNLLDLPPHIKAELRDRFYIAHENAPEAKQRFDNAMAKKKSTSWKHDDCFSLPRKHS